MNRFKVSKIFLTPDKGKQKALVSVLAMEAIWLTGMRVIEGANGLFVSMPSRKSGEEYQDIYFPASKDAREELQKTVLEAYHAQLAA